MNRFEALIKPLNQTGDPEISGVEQALLYSGVYDKDQASESLAEIPRQYRKLGVGEKDVKRQISNVIEPLKRDLEAGDRNQQVRAAQRIKMVHECLANVVK